MSYPEQNSWHGTLGGYTYHRCRCDECRGAMRDYDISRRAAARVERERLRAEHPELFVRPPRERKGPDPVKVAAHRRKRTERIRLELYGLTPDEHAAMVAAQKGRCAICLSDIKSLCVDHDHGTGDVRGLLCNPCNLALGCFRDCPDRLESAIAYIQR